jgi:tRNA A37 threonylcarbamoyladenosine modification protein TsaB
MKVLAIELSSSLGSIAVAKGDTIAERRTFACERGRGTGVFAALEESRDLWRDAEVIAVGIGPGSYNGLRTACAVATSIQMATGAKLCAIPSPCLLAIGDEHYAVYGDARGGRAYRAEVRDRKICGEISLISHADAMARTEGELVQCYRIGAVPGLDRLPDVHPDAAVLGLLARHVPTLSPGDLEPIYLKPPHITLPRSERT